MKMKECRPPPVWSYGVQPERCPKGQRAAVAACPAKYARVEHGDEGVQAAADVVVWRSAGEMSKRK